MRKYLVNLWIEDNGKKITAIRSVRYALGLGLTEAKNLVEQNNYRSVDLILNGDQVAGLTEIAGGECSGGVGQPHIYIHSITRVQAPAAADYSHVNFD